jgi:hypothetical protein
MKPSASAGPYTVYSRGALQQQRLSVLGADRAEQRERVEGFRDFCEFGTQAYRDELMRMWTDYRAKRRPR